MHILHFLCVASESPKEACETAETYIEDFGDDNNYRTIGGCISQDNEVYIHDRSAAFSPDDDNLNTVEKVRAYVIEHMTGLRTNEEIIEELKKENPQYYDICEWALIKSEVASFGGHPTEFDLWQHEFFCGYYDRFGYTQCPFDRDLTITVSDDGEEDGYITEPGMKLYIVFIDIHV